jgi:GTPase SAR1 family protein
MGPAGSGKSTYCATIVTHCQNIGRSVHLVNLDPAAERFEYQPTIDIKDLITLEDVMEELQYGPNGGLIYCMEFLMNNIDWLEEELGAFEDDYLIFDCPGQIELYTHFPIMRRITETLQRWNFSICGVYLLESQFIEDKSKYFAGVLSAMSAMINLEIPHINVMSKMDLLEEGGLGQGRTLTPRSRRKGARKQKQELDQYFEADPLLLVDDVNEQTSPRFHSLNQAIVQLIDDYNVVSFIPLNIKDEDSIEYLLSSVDNAMQYGEDLEPREPNDEVEED